MIEYDRRTRRYFLDGQRMTKDQIRFVLRRQGCSRQVAEARLKVARYAQIILGDVKADIDLAGARLLLAHLWQALEQDLARRDAMRYIAANLRPARRPNRETIRELKHNPGVSERYISAATFREALIQSGYKITADGERCYCREVR